MSENRPINPELIASKLNRIRNFENRAILEEIEADPRLVEALWFIQWVSMPQNYPGGLAKFASDLIAESRDFLTTPTMKANAGKRYSEAVRNAILEELPSSLRWDRQVEPSRMPWELSGDQIVEWKRKEEERKRRDEAERKARHLSMEEPQVLIRLTEGALEGLAQYLERLCEVLDVRFRGSPIDGAPGPFRRFSEAILRFMDRWKATQLAKIAETDITRQCLAWLEKAARLPGRGVIIEGNSRFGKTDAVRAWCQAHPGRARFVRTPPAGGESEMLRAVAIALGVPDAFNHRAIKLRAEIEHVLRHSGLTLVFDEAHYIFPTCFNKNTAPVRLNWIRHAAMDAGCPVVFIVTPQSYRAARGKFVKTTGFAVEQFDGRILKKTLPSEVSREDLLAIARIHFRGVPEDSIQYVVSKLASTERNYVSDVSNVATLAFFNAELAGRSIPKLADIKGAIADVLPPSDPAAAGATFPQSPKRGHQAGPDTGLEANRAADPLAENTDPSRLAAPFQRSCMPAELPVHDRDTSPAFMPGGTPLERFDAAAIDLASPP